MCSNAFNTSFIRSITQAMLQQTPHNLPHLPAHTEQLLAQLRQLMPDVFIENSLDILRLHAALGIATPPTLPTAEHYELTWTGKAAARREAQLPATHTLHPLSDDAAVQHSTAQPPPHCFIAGENLEVLRILQKSYYGKINIVYIDPPYNTGNDSFMYADQYAETQAQYLQRSQAANEAGYLHKLHHWKKNTRENGQFHSVWLSMMYPRLYLSRQLLANDGVIFISIDDNEADNLKLLCDEIFGETNFVGKFIWHNRTTPNDTQNNFATDHEYIVVYAKDNPNQLRFKGVTKDLSHYKNPDNDPQGAWVADNPSAASGNDSYRFEIRNPHTNEVYAPPKGRFWAFAPKRVAEWTASGKLVFPKEKGKNFLLKKYKNELQSHQKPISSIIQQLLTLHGTKELKALFDDASPFRYPKPTALLQLLLDQLSTPHSLILDFFAGSGTTLHAVAALNAADGGQRQCIAVQLPEPLSPDNDAYKAGYRYITDIAQARISKALQQIAAQTNNEPSCCYYTVKKSGFKLWNEQLLDKVSLEQALYEHQNPAEAPANTTALLTELCLQLGLGLGVAVVYEQGFYKTNSVRCPQQYWFCVTAHDTEQLWHTAALGGGAAAYWSFGAATVLPPTVVLLHAHTIGKDEQIANLRLLLNEQKMELLLV